MSLLNDASLVFIPSGYKEDKVYSVIPSNGAGDLDFVRGCDATRINPQSLVENTPWNLLTYSEDFTNVDWTKSDVTVTANNTTAPNGTNTADKIVENSSNGAHFIETVRPAIADQVYTISIYFKKAERNYGVLGVYTNQSKQLFVDLTTGAITNTVGTFLSTSVETLSNGWFRVIVTFTATSIIYPFFAISDNGTNISYTGNGTSGIYAWGIQLNIGSTAKQYFPTTDRLNVPRLDYTNSTCPSLLLEKQSTNLATYSEDFSNATWDKIDATITTNASISPDGTMTADRLYEAATSGNHGFYKNLNISTGTDYSFSCYVKKGNRRYCGLQMWYSITIGSIAFFDLDNGTLVYEFEENQFGSGYDIKNSKITSVGNDWYRLEATIQVGIANSYFGIVMSDSLWTTGTSYDNPYTGDTSKYLDIWGFQIEQSSYHTSYIPTTSATVTRLADSCYKNSISSLIGQSSGVVFADIVPFQFLDGSYIGISDNASTSNRQIFGFEGDSGNSGTLRFFGWYSGASITCTAGQRYKIAMAYANNDFVIYVNGTQVVNQTSGTVTGTLSHFGFDSYTANTQNFKGQVNAVALFKRRLTNTELEKLTTL